MADNAVVLLDALLDEREKQYGETPPPKDEAFELFAFEQALKEQDLSVDEIAAGQVGGGNDGGIDGVYTFLNGNLVDEDAEVLAEGFDTSKVRRNSDLALAIVQAKQTASFGETAFDKVTATLADVLDLGRDVEDLKDLYSEGLLDRIEIFRRAWRTLATRHPVIHVRFVYATKGDTRAINEKVFVKAERLREFIPERIPQATAEVEFLGARELVDLAGREKSYTLQLRFVENATAAESHIALVTLNDYFDFITDEHGQLRKYIFDWNVRDYEGAVEVNKEIAETLAAAEAPEFWWLNNGVTVICSRASTQGKTFSLDDVQVVNGLQTSVTIYEHLGGAPDDDSARSRSLLVRVIVTEEHDTRDRVIRATNRQTYVPVASLRATDQVQRDLERYFLNHDWFYERRKNYYRNQGKTPARIVTIPYLAQAMMAIGLSDPSNSRARPSSLLKRDQDYERIFDARIDYATFLWAAQVQKAVDDFLRSDAAAASSSERTNLRFHVSMLLVARAFGDRVYNPSQLAALVGAEFDAAAMVDALEGVRDALADFQKNHDGTIDQIAKARDFTEFLLDRTFPREPSSQASGTEPSTTAAG